MTVLLKKKPPTLFPSILSPSTLMQYYSKGVKVGARVRATALTAP